MIKIGVLGIVFLLQLSLQPLAKMQGSLECVVFINSEIPEQLSLFFQFNSEYYSSRTLQNKGKVTFINISNQLINNNYTIPVINDTQGIWVSKFKPAALPALFSMYQDKHLPRVIATTAEIRQCLQGK